MPELLMFYESVADEIVAISFLALVLKFHNLNSHFCSQTSSAISFLPYFNCKLLAAIFYHRLINHLIRYGISPPDCVYKLLCASKKISIELDSRVSVTPLLKLKPKCMKCYKLERLLTSVRKFLA